LQAIGVDNIEALIAQTVPDSIRMKKPLNLPEGIDEHVFLKHLHDLAEKNKLYETFIGLGYHAAITPAVIQRNILENPGWYTAYTPYQPEIAQGRLEAIFNFQTVVSDLTGMELANASLLDESTAAAEGMTMLFSARSREQKKQGAVRFFVDENILPQTLSLLQTRALPLGIELVEG
ncbi:MAG: glycine dehydrogenase (aminomethyl-transferring), partial [Flavobacteriaceae bacterium]